LSQSVPISACSPGARTRWPRNSKVESRKD
jgi:hypothetical protein